MLFDDGPPTLISSETLIDRDDHPTEMITPVDPETTMLDRVDVEETAFVGPPVPDEPPPAPEPLDVAKQARRRPKGIKLSSRPTKYARTPKEKPPKPVSPVKPLPPGGSWRRAIYDILHDSNSLSGLVLVVACAGVAFWWAMVSFAPQYVPPFLNPGPAMDVSRLHDPTPAPSHHFVPPPRHSQSDDPAPRHTRGPTGSPRPSESRPGTPAGTTEPSPTGKPTPTRKPSSPPHTPPTHTRPPSEPPTRPSTEPPTEPTKPASPPTQSTSSPPETVTETAQPTATESG